MISSMTRMWTFALALGAAVLPTLAAAQSVEEFYKGRTIKLNVAAAVGGGADLYARVLVRHLGKHIPGNPGFVVQNLPGAGGLVVAGQMQNNTTPDGATIALLQRNNLIEPILAERDVGFDPRKVIWLGSLNKDTYLIFSWHTSGVATLQDAMQKELILGNTGGGNENVTFPLMLNQVLGTKFKLVRGYKGSDDVALAIQRGEVQGRAITWTTLRGDHADWLAQKKVNVLVQLATKRNPELPDLPSAIEFVKNPDDRQLFELMFASLEAGRPFAVPPGTPADRVAALRKAFADLPNDKEFVAELQSRGGSVEFLSGQDMETLITNFYKTPPALVDRARKLVNEK
jgi:tripartite-type tricarboxylate transporter receptor subunit TctC